MRRDRRTGSTRRRLLLWSAPVVALLLVFAAKVLFVAFVTSSGTGDYRAGNYRAAAGSYAHLGVLNVYERWIAPYDRGDALYGLRSYGVAEQEFAHALPLAPADEKCRVRGNLALAGEQVGNQAVKAKSRTGAITAYTRALRNATEGHCASLAGRRAQLQHLLDLLRQKQPKSPSHSSPPSHGGSPAPNPAERLKQRNQRAANEQGNSDQANQPAPTKFPEKPW